MHTNDQAFSAILAIAALRASDEDIQAIVVEDLLDRIAAGEDIESEISAAQHNTHRTGDFGMEIIGPVLVPILIEAGKGLWSAYAKTITEKIGADAAKFTVDKIKQMAQSFLKSKDAVPAMKSYEERIREEAERQGIKADQVEGLLRGIRSGEMSAHVGNSED